MSNTALPKELQSAYQRWEMNSFDDESHHTQSHAPQPAKISIEEAASLREAARAKGYAEGLAAGHAAGLEQSRDEVNATLINLQQIADSFGAEVERADDIIAQDMLDLALDISKAMLKSALAIHPELVLPIVGEAIRYLPSLQQPALLFLNPADAVIVKEHMNDELLKAGWRVADDAHIERGGCRVETASNQIDATASTRWQRLAEAFGKDSNWLAEP